MNLRSVALYVAFAAAFPRNTEAQVVKNFIYNLDRILEFLTFGLIDIRENDPIEEIDDELPGGIVFGGVCDRLKNIAINQFLPEIPEEIEPIIDNIKCGCDVLRLGGEMKFGCNFENPVCVDVGSLLGLDDFTFSPTVSLFPTRSPLPTVPPPTAPPAPVSRSRRNHRRMEELAPDLSFCITANVRADYNGRSPLTPFAEETLTTRACAEIINATFFIPDGVKVPKVCAVVEHNEGLVNLVSLKSCTLFAVRSDGSTDTCKKCEICGEDGLGVLFDCSNVNFDSTGKTNFTLPPFDEVCLSAGTIPLSKLKDEDFVYRPFLTPMP